MVNPLISLKAIEKKYHVGTQESIVLKQISLDVHQGDMLAIVGASGSGKSTLMNIIGLLDKADNGNYFLQGRNVASLSADERALVRNKQIGFVFQQFNLLQRFNAMQNVALPLTYRKVSSAQVSHDTKKVLARVGMSAFSDHLPTQLSGGQQQRIAIARALVGNPQVILADEPTGALDSATGQDIINLFLELHAEGRTIILITHDEKIAACCKRRITLADGKIIAESVQ